MDIKFWASFSVICILVHCCHTGEARPGRSAKCKGLLKGPNCPSSNISFTKRLLDEIMKRTDGGTAADSDMQWDQTRTEDKLNVEETKSVMAPADGWSLPGRAVEGTQQEQQLAARHEAEEAELRRKELEILFVRALLDDLENDTLNEM